MYYLELTLIKNDKRPYQCWSLLFNQVHLSLAEFAKLGISSLGVSFPNYYFKENEDKTIARLGDNLRIFGNNETLKIFEKDLMARLDKFYPDWQDDIHKKSIKPVPENCTYVIFSRHHNKNIQEIAKEFAKHKNISFDEALIHCQTHKAKPKNYPFLCLNSLSSDKTFNLYIKKTIVDNETKGEFNSYGLSNTATVPEF